MKTMLRSLIAVCLIAQAAPAAAQDAAANFPSKPIRIMGQGQGSTADYLSRFLGQRLQEKWGQAVVVDLSLIHI